jgi:hypothetical protein
MTPYIRTIGRVDGWELHVDYAGVEHVLGAPVRQGRRRAKLGAHDCRLLEDRLRRAAARFGWAAAIQAEEEGMDLFEKLHENATEPADNPPRDPPPIAATEAPVSEAVR